MFAHLVSMYHLHPIVDHFTIALLTFGIAAEILAAAEYTKILRIYTDLVVRGELPQEEQTAKSES